MKCLRCQHDWKPSVPNPKCCPACKSYKYHTPARGRTYLAPEPPTKSVVDIPEPDDWQFTKDAPQFGEDGFVYRQQKLAPDFKRSRTVKVDEDDTN